MKVLTISPRSIFSGTAQKPEQDLSPRVAHEVGKSPLLALKLFFNQGGEWFDFN